MEKNTRIPVTITFCDPYDGGPDEWENTTIPAPRDGETLRAAAIRDGYSSRTLYNVEVRDA